VTAVERGSWTGDRLVFVVTDAWPTVESGIMVEKMPWVYRAGAELRMGLRTGREVVEIVGVEGVGVVTWR
jgi:hypothetical protein